MRTGIASARASTRSSGRSTGRTANRRGVGRLAIAAAIALAVGAGARAAEPAGLRAGVAKVDVTDREAGPVNDPLYVKALVLEDEATTAVLVTVDAVAIGEIGPVGNDYLPTVRSRLEREMGIDPANVLVNASHCHGAVCGDVAERTVQAVRSAREHLVPVRVGAGVGQEDRIMENRRLKLKDGREADVRHAYSLPPDDAVAAVGPIDPEIGILRLDRLDGAPLAVVFHFACHPIQGVPGGGTTADLAGFASTAVETSLGHGAIALFVQGCAGDVNPAWYKQVALPRDAEPLGNLLGLSTVKALRQIETTRGAALRVVREVIELPRADHAERIAALETEQARLVQSLRGTSLNLKTFLPLAVRYGLAGEFPSCDSHRYLHEERLGREHLKRLDAENRRNMQQYVRNVHVMEELTRIQTNLALLKKHQARNAAAAKPTIDVELLGMRVGDFVLLSFPGELSVEIGLKVKRASPHEFTFVAGCSNGYIYYAPTAEQLASPGAAQEDSDCLLAPEWQKVYEAAVAAMLARL